MKNLGLKNATVHWNLSPNELEKISLQRNLGRLTNTGALAVNTGEFTGRSPKDRFIVKDEITENTVWWDGKINLPFDEYKFEVLYNRVIDYLSNKELFARDAFACADERYRLKLRIITELPWVSLFAYNMFIRPSKDELEGFVPKWTVIQAPKFL